MHPVAYIEIVSALACLAAIVFLIRGWKRGIFLPAVQILLLVLLVLMMFYGIVLFLEWSVLRERFHWHFIEDLMSVFIPLIWSFAFYAFVKNTVEDDLRTSRTRFRNLVESTSDWIWEVDRENRYTYVSPRVERILGYTPDELLGKTPFELMPPDEAARVSAAFFEACEKKMPIGHLENLNLHKSGHEVILESNAVPIFDAKGILTGYRGVDRDITKRKKAERLTAQRQAELDSIFAASPAGIGLVHDRRLIRGNARLYEIMGCSEDELIGKDARRFYMTEQEYLDVGAKYNEALQAGFAQIETRWVRKDQTVIDMELYIAPLEPRDNDTAFVVVMQDITELKTARQQAMAEKTRARLYLDVAGVMIVVLDKNHRVKLINKKGCEILGYSAEQVLGVDWFSKFLPASYRAITQNAFDRILSGEEKSVEYFENPVLTRSGNERLIAWHNSVLRDSAGKIIGVVSSGEDVTEIRAAEEALRRSDQQLRLALSAAQMGTWRWDAKKNQDVRDATLNAILGLEAVETTQPVDDFFKYVHPDDLERMRAEFTRAIDKKEAYKTTFRIVRADGQTRWVQASGKTIYDFNGALTSVAGVLIDITEREKANRLLQEQRSEMQSIFRAAPIGIGVLMDRKFVRINARMCNMLGYSEDELLGQNARMIYPTQEDYDFVGREKYRQISEYGTGTVETRWQHKDGKIINILLSSTPFDNEDWSKGVTFAALDITERVRNQQALQLTQFAIDHAVEGIFWMKTDGTFFYVNEAACRSLGYTSDELLQMSVYDIDPDIGPEEWSDLWKHKRDQGSYHIESRHKTKDGQIFPVEINSNFVVYDGNEYSIAFVRDITDRKRVAEALVESEQRFRNIVESSPMGIHTYSLEADGRLVLTGANAASSKILGRDFTDKIGRTIEEVYPPLAKTEVPDTYRRLCRQGGIYQNENFEYHDDFVSGFYTFTAFQTSPGNMATLFVDVTDRIMAEQVLRFTQFAIDHTSEEVYWINEKGQFVYINDAACEVLGYSREELLKMTVSDIDPDFTADVWPKHWKELKQNQTMRFESRHKTKDGCIFPVEITANYLVYEDVEYNCAFCRDISERKAAEQTREILMQQLRERSDELHSIVFTAAHDLRSPLVNIDGFTHELEKGLQHLAELIHAQSMNKQTAERINYLFETDMAESLRFIKSGSHQMGMLLDGLMHLSRVGSAPLSVSILNMNELLGTVIEGLQYHIKEYNVTVNVQPNLPHCMGDAILLSQVFTNLLDNAIKYRHPDRSLVIKITATVIDGMAEYNIADNGIGIEPEHLEKVFELFHQLGDTKDEDGQGVGLTIVRRILDRLNGNVKIDSTPNVGTTVHIRLPMT